MFGTHEDQNNSCLKNVAHFRPEFKCVLKHLALTSLERNKITSLSLLISHCSRLFIQVMKLCFHTKRQEESYDNLWAISPHLMLHLRLNLKLLCYGSLKSFCRKQNGSCSALVRDTLHVAKTPALFGATFSTGNLL